MRKLYSQLALVCKRRGLWSGGNLFEVFQSFNIGLGELAFDLLQNKHLFVKLAFSYQLDPIYYLQARRWINELARFGIVPLCQ